MKSFGTKTSDLPRPFKKGIVAICKGSQDPIASFCLLHFILLQKNLITLIPKSLSLSLSLIFIGFWYFLEDIAKASQNCSKIADSESEHPRETICTRSEMIKSRCEVR